MNQQIKPTDPILDIGELADRLNIHQRTLRIYDAEGILRPVRTEKNRRKYSFNDFEKCRLILFLTRNLAMNLMGVKLFLGLFNKYKINFSKLNKLAIEFGINEQIQQENIAKTAKRGRKPNPTH